MRIKKMKDRNIEENLRINDALLERVIFRKYGN
jgi:hypothetical protein